MTTGGKMTARKGNRPMHVPRKAAMAGFTLIELMVVVAVVAILASIAVPSYNEQVRKARRATAKADLVEYAQLAERRFTVDNTYGNFDVPTTVSPREDGATARYNLNAAVAPTTFTITATPTGAQTEDRCGTLSITNTGQKTSTGTAPANECW
jgi:type IV pilus assembly protein PilE